MTSGELAASLGLVLRGESLPLNSAAVLNDAGPEQLAFIAGPKYFDAAKVSHAACLIAPPEYEGPQPVIESPQPRAHFALALKLLYPQRQLKPGIHPTAVIDPGAVIGEDAHIGPHVTIYGGVIIGKRCVIHAGAVIGADGFGFEMAAGAWQKVPQVGTVEIGDDVEIGANTCIDRAALGVTSIGDGTKLDNMVHIAHNCRIGKHVVIAAQTGLAGGVEIGDYAIVGGQVGIGDKARIEARAIVGSGAGILTSKIVRAGEPVWGTPARPLRQYLAQLATLARLAKRR